MARAKKRPVKKKSSIKPLLLKIGLTLFAVLCAFIIWLDSWVMRKFDDKKWSIPASVYARPLELYQGLALSQTSLIRELQAAGYQQNKSGVSGSYSVQGSQVTIALRPFKFWDEAQDSAGVQVSFNNDRVSQLRSTLDNSLTVRLEPVEIGKIHVGKLEERVLVSISEVPQPIIQGLLATEDRHFFEHHGISIKSIARAFIANIRHGKVVEGGSTLTQQLVKNFFLDNARSITRKALEAMIAVLLELRASKGEILEAYINEVYVAQDGARAIHGFGLASQYLFNKPMAELELHESALLVGMMKGPSYYNPLRHPQRALERRNLVLSLMASQGYITEARAEQAKKRGLGIDKQQIEISATYPAYLDLVRRQLLRDYSEEQLSSEGLRVFTNLDPHWQWHSQAMLQQGIKQIAQRYPNAPDIDGGVVVIDHATGDVLAVVGSKNPRYAGFNRALDAKRPIGSLVKPAVYLAGLEKGYTLTSKLIDSPITVKTSKGDWQPQNYSREFYGDVPFYLALANSYNAATVRLGMDVGLNKVIETLRRLGVEKNIPQLPSLLLGTLELSPLEVAQMYGTIAATGFYTPLKSIREVTDYHGNKLKRYPLRLEQRITPENQHIIDFALQTVMHDGTGKSVEARFPANTLIAGKTGTTNDQRDSWFAGYDRNRLAVVWLGDDNNGKLPITGSTGALPIWADILLFNRSAQGASILPNSVQYHWVQKNTGLLTAENCENAVYLPYVKGKEPKQSATCTIEQRSRKHWFKRWFSNFD